MSTIMTPTTMSEMQASIIQLVSRSEQAKPHDFKMTSVLYRLHGCSHVPDHIPSGI